MRHVVIASHHRYAEGLKDTLEFVLGPQVITVICAYLDNTPLSDQIADVFSRFDVDDEVLVLSDMLAGSVNQVLKPYASDHVHLIAGINVPCALELISEAGPLTSESIRRAVEQAREQLVYVNELIVSVDAEDE